MFLKNFYHDFNLISGFASERDYGLHTGKDFSRQAFKNTNILNLLSGIIYGIGHDKHFGEFITLKHNPKFIGGINEEFYSLYGHLSFKNNLKKRQFVKYGTILGKMGNTGKCMTFRDGKWEYLTKKEIENPKETRGVHLHLMIFQKAAQETFTKFLNDIFMQLNITYKIDHVRIYLKEEENTIIISKIINEDYGNIAFWQWGRVYINPLIVCEYFSKLKELTPAA